MGNDTAQDADVTDDTEITDTPETNGQPAAADDADKPGSGAYSAPADDSETHPDDIEFQRLLAEAEAEEGSPEAEPQDDSDTAEQPADGEGQTADAPKAAERAEHRIPKARLDEVLRQKADLEAQLAAALAAAAGTKLTVDQIEEQLIDVAKKYDEGELSAADWERQKRGLERQWLAAQMPEPAEDPRVAAETTRLEADYAPVLAKLTDEAASILVNTIRSERAVLGQPALDTIGLRRAVCERAADVMGVKIVPSNASDADDKQSVMKKLAPRHKGAPDPRVFPPAPSTVGSAQAQRGDITLAEIEKMSVEQISNLPAAIREQFLR